MYKLEIFFLIGQITLVAIGPLTTVATCIICDPAFGSRLDSMLIMGGTSAAEGNVTINAEFNFLFDPEAAHVVINRANCRLRIVPWETCYRHKIDWVIYSKLNSYLQFIEFAHHCVIDTYKIIILGMEVE